MVYFSWSHCGFKRMHVVTIAHIDGGVLRGFNGIKLRLLLCPYCTAFLDLPSRVYRSYGTDLLQLGLH